MRAVRVGFPCVAIIAMAGGLFTGPASIDTGSSAAAGATTVAVCAAALPVVAASKIIMKIGTRIRFPAWRSLRICGDFLRLESLAQCPK